MRRHWLIAAALGLALAGCGPAASTPPATQSPVATEAPTPPSTVVPSVVASSSAADPFADQPYSLVLPAGWRAFNLGDPAQKAALDAIAQANPNLAASMQLVQSMPGVRMAVNPLLADTMIALTLPTNGVPLDVLEQSFDAQFKAVPGVDGVPTPTAVPLPGGTAVHWSLSLKVNKPGGGTLSIDESVYLLANSSTAVIMEFVTPGGGVIPDESAIVGSFAFR